MWLRFRARAGLAAGSAAAAWTEIVLLTRAYYGELQTVCKWVLF